MIQGEKGEFKLKDSEIRVPALHSQILETETLEFKREAASFLPTPTARSPGFVFLCLQGAKHQL